jgi:quinol-cytochrome oxidoreductase complex cytochrome b subunit
MKRKSSSVRIFVSSLVLSYPRRGSLRYIWNMGSLISFLMVFQVVTGVLLTLFYSPRSLLAFGSVDFLTRETIYGVFIRVIHLNFASLIFLFLFLHMFRGLYFSSFKQAGAWLRGSGLFGLSMLSAFLGYVLP